MGMLAVHKVERQQLQEKQVLQRSMIRDEMCNIPHRVHRPDDPRPFGTKPLKYHTDTEEKELTRTCVRGPPNVTLYNGTLKARTTSSPTVPTHQSPNVRTGRSPPISRCDSAPINTSQSVILPPQMSSRNHNRTLPEALAQITMVPCLTDRRSSSSAMSAEQHSNRHQPSSGVFASPYNCSSSGKDASSTSSSSSSLSSSCHGGSTTTASLASLAVAVTTSTMPSSASMGVVASSRIPTTAAPMAVTSSAVTILPTTRQV